LNNKNPSNKVYKIKFDTESRDISLCDFTFPNPNTNAELLTLKKKYKLDELVRDAESDLEKAMIILNWTNSRWEHSSSNTPQKKDVLSILEEAEKGKSFRCVEYGIVLSAALNSIGIPTRTLGLKTKDVEIVEWGAGHVVSEAYIPELKKWVFLDGQINYIPFLDRVPLNAIEYQKAIINKNKEIELRNIKGALNKRIAVKIIKWVSKYLFYFNTNFDNSSQCKKCKGKKSLMLVPLNEKNPTIFQIKYKIDYCIYTNKVKDFYKEPVIL